LWIERPGIDQDHRNPDFLERAQDAVRVFRQRADDERRATQPGLPHQNRDHVEGLCGVGGGRQIAAQDGVSEMLQRVHRHGRSGGRPPFAEVHDDRGRGEQPAQPDLERVRRRFDARRGWRWLGHRAEQPFVHHVVAEQVGDDPLRNAKCPAGQ
jgi:hypothetical protein